MRQLPISFFLFLGSMLLQTTLSAQFREEYFEDLEPTQSHLSTAIQNGNYIYTCGSTLDSWGLSPAVRKIDLQGNQVWYSNAFGFSADEFLPVSMLPSGGDIFVTSQAGPGSFAYTLSRVDDATGGVYFNQEFQTGGSFRVADYNATQLLAYYPTNYPLHNLVRISKSTGQVQGVTPVLGDYPTGGFTTLPNVGVYFSIRDTIYRHNYGNLAQKMWAVKVSLPGNDPIKRFNKLIAVAAENAVYAFGYTLNQERICVAKINASTGAVLWTYLSGIYQSATGPVVFKDGNLYLSGQHLYVGGGTYQQTVAKINPVTGLKIWETATEQVPNNYNEQSGQAMAVENGKVYLTGYYDADNYGPGKWGVLSIDDADGAVLFRKQIPPTAVSPDGEKLSGGRAVFAIGDHITVLGNAEKAGYETYMTWVEMNLQNGSILKRKVFGGAGRFPASVQKLVQLNSGKIISLIQQGRTCVVRQTDASGNIGWEKQLTADFGMKAMQLYQVRGDSFIVACLSYADEAGFISNAQSVKTLRLYLMNGAGTLTRTLNRAWPTNYRFIRGIVSDPQAEFYYINFMDSNGSSNRIGKFNFSGWVSESQAFGSFNFLGAGETMCISKANNELYLFENGAYRFSLANWPTFDFFQNVAVWRLKAVLQKDSFIVAAGYSQSNQPVIWLYKGSQVVTPKMIDNIPNLKGFVDMVQGENPSTVYLAAEGGDSYYLIKFDIDTWSVVWAMPIFGPGESQVTHVNEIVFNPTSKSVTVCGANIVPGMDPDWQVFVKSFDGASGNKIMESFKNTFPETVDEAVTAVADRNSSTAIIGGYLLQNSFVPTIGFMQYFDLGSYSNVKALLYWDQDENGAFDKSVDTPMNVGNIHLDNGAAVLYFNEQGIASAAVSPGAHDLSFDMIPGWQLSSAAASATVSTFQQANDTFFIGIKPLASNLTTVGASLTGAHFICGDTATVYLNVNNYSPGFAQAEIWLKYPGGFQSASLFPDEQQGDSLLYWSIQNIAPFSHSGNQLQFKMPDAGALGDSLRFDLRMRVPDAPGPGLTDTVDIHFRDALRCSFDPNDKLATPAGEGPDGLTKVNTPITYTIRFQNTGNFVARNIVIRDTLDGHFDLTSLAFAASSHLVSSMSLRGNILEFYFDNINLPESTNNFTDSQGYVSFTLAPLGNLANNVPVRNSAGIYFDGNAPIKTNTTLNTYVGGVSVVVNPGENDGIIIFPNPNTGAFTLELPEPATAGMAFRITDLAGRFLLEGQLELGSSLQHIQGAELSAGLYFLQVSAGGKILAVEKFVKQ